MTRRRLLLLSLLLALLTGGLSASPVRAQEGGIRCTTTTAQSIINTGQSIFFSAEPRSTESGGVIFFWSTGDLEGGGQNADGNIEIFRSELHFNADGSVTRTFRQITRSTGSILGGFNLAPDISADGRHLAFFSDRHYPGSGFDNSDGNFEIFVADLSDLDRVSIRQITNSTQGSNLYPTISDDGRWLAFISDNGLDPETAGEVPDAEHNLDIYLADLSVNPVVFQQVTQTRLGVLNEAPNLSGDGSTLIFASTQDVGNPEGNLEIYRYGVRSGLMTPVTTTPGGTNEMPVVNRDGSRVAFVSDQRLDSTVNIVGERQIFLSPNPAIGTGFLQVSDTPGADNFGPSISADGNRVIYQRQDSTSGQRVVLYDVVAQSRQVFRSRTNPTGGEVGAPILSGNGTVLFYEDEGGISTVECSISDLGLTTNAAPASAVAGDSFAYVWTVSNLDQAIASGVQVQATLPAGLRLGSIEPASICPVNGQSITCTFSRLEVGESRTMTATVQTGVDSLGDLTTQVAASSLTTVDRNPSNNSQRLTTSVSAQADLGIVKAASPDTALQGEEITYTLSISSTGPSLARNVQVTDTLPAGLAFVSSPSCVASSGQALCALGNVQPGDLLTVTIRTRVDTFQEQDIVNRAVIGSETTDDPAPLNNRAVVTNSVNTKFDLAVVGSVAPAPLVAGGPIAYRYEVTNFGPSVSDNVELSVTLPVELTSIGQPQVLGAGSCITGTVFTCDLGSLPRTQAVTVIVTGSISSTLSGPIFSLAAVRSTTEGNADKNPANDTSGVTASVVQQADLRASKNGSAATVVAGATLTYTLGVFNHGPSTAPVVTISDTLPAGVTITGLATSLGSCTGSGLVSCTLNRLLPQEQATVTVTVRVSSSALGVITNTVSVQSSIFDPNLTNNAAAYITDVKDEADLKLVKVASVDFATSGQDSFFYILSVANYGPSLARSVLLTDTLPANLTYTGSTLPNGSACSQAGGIVTCALDGISAGITQTVRIDVSTAAAATGALVNSATVSSSALDRVADNSATATVNASQLADLQVTKNAIIANLNVGGTITYTVNVDNFGPSNATGVVISDVLPGQLLSPVVALSQGSYSQSTGLWTAGSLAAGQRLTMTVAGSLGAAASGQVITNTALLSAVDQTDPTAFNNGQFVTFTVPLNADVALLQSASPLTPSVQSAVTFVLTATNNGPETATAVQVSDRLPTQLSYTAQIASAGSYSATTGLWSIGSLSNGASAVLTITAQVIGSGSFTNPATISAAQHDDNLADNASAIGLTVAPAADLALTNVPSPSAPNVGDTLFFTVRVTNDGPDAVADVQVADVPAAGSTVSPAAGTSYSETTGLWTIPALSVGESTTLVISRAVALSGSVTNQAEIVAASLFDPDSTPGNGVGNGEDDQSLVTLAVPVASDLDVSMSASGGQLVGQDVLLPIQITNRGPDVATNIVLSETLPTHLAYRTHFIQGAGVYVPATGAWMIPSLGVGEFTILNITARVEAGAAGQRLLDEVEGVRLDQYDPGQFPNSASASFQVGGADLAVTKSVDRANADAGTPVVYTISVLNNGPSATANVRITDSLPLSLTGIISSTSAGDFGPNTPGSPGVWRIPELGVGASETLVLTGTVIPGTANRVITNTVSAATSSVADGDLSNNSAAIGFRVTAADLVLQKSATITQPQEGDSFSYILNVTNLGPDPATNVVVTDTMSTGMTATVAGAGYNIATGRWDVGDISSGQSRSLILTVSPVVDVGGGLVIIDPIDSKSADQEDPTPAINAAARVTITVVGADLRLVKVVSKTTPNVGETVSFTVTLTNPGPYATAAVIVTDTLPAGLTLSGTPIVTVGSLAVDGTNRIFTWTNTSAAIGLNARLHLTATVDSGTGGQSLVNRAAIVSAAQTSGSAMPDPNRANNTATATVTPQAADLSIALADSPDPVSAGAILLYTAYITNSGPTAAANPVVTVTLPSGVSLGSVSALCESSGFPTIVCTSTSSLGVSASRSFTATVVQSTVTTLGASASTGTSTPETDTSNNSASASTSVNAATASKLVITGSGSQTAGNSQDLTITAYDDLGNVVTNYAGDKSLTFSGASVATDGTNPTVEDKDGAAIPFGTATTITFASGVATVSSGDNGVLVLYAAESATISVSDGAIDSTRGGDLAVTVAAAMAAKLVLSGSSSQTAGASQDLAITAQDSYSNTATGYSGDKALTFSGASAGSDGTNPTVSDKDGTVIAFGNSITLTFASGVAGVSSGSNGAMILYAAETATVSVSEGSIDSTGGGDLAVTVSSATAAVLVISGSATQTAGESQDLTIAAQDAFSNTATSYTGSKTLTFSGASAAPDGTDPEVVNSSGVTVTFGSDTAITFSSGVATAGSGSNGVLVLYAAETATVAASDGTIDSAGGGGLVVTVSPAAANRLVYTTQPSATASAGGTFSQQPVVEIRDAFENVAAASDDILLSAFTNSSCSTPAPGVLNGRGPLAASSGVATFSTVSYNQVGTIRLQASDVTNSGVATACSSAVAMSAGAAGSLTVQTQPSNATAGAVLPTQPVVTLRDNSGNIVTADSTSTVTAAVQSGPGGFHTSSTTAVVLSSGVATFTNLRLDTAGSYTLTFFTSAGAFTATSAGFTVSPGVAARLAITGSTTQVAGDNQNLSITAQDSAGNTATGYTGSKNLTFSGAGVAPNGTTLPTVSNSSGTTVNFGTPTAITFASGVATGSGGANGVLRLVKVETATVAVTDTASSINSSGGGNLTVTVSPGSATKLVIGGSPAQTAGITQSLTITALDSVGNTATGYTGSKSLTFSGASAAPDTTPPTVKNGSGATVNFGGATAINFSSGVATVSGGSNGVMALYAVENATIAATDGTISATGADRLSVAVSPDTAEHLAFSIQPGSSATVGTNFSPQPVVQVQDQFDNVVNVSDSISLTAFTDAGCSSAAAGTLSGGAALAAVSGMATFSGVSYTKAETIRLKASDATDGSITAACSSAVAVAHGAASQLVVTTQPGSASVGLAFVQQPVVELRDSEGNLVTSDSSSLLTASVASGPGGLHGSSTVQISFAAGVATYTNLRLDSAGSYTLRFTRTPGGLTVDSTSFTVSGGTAIRLVISGSGSQTAGGSQSLTITAKDSVGNTDTSYTGDRSLTFSGASDAPNGTKPTVTDKNGVAQDFGSPTTITFVNGVATVSAAANGSLVLVKVETAVIAVSDGSISAAGGDRLTVNVSPGAPENLTFSQQPSSTAAAGVSFTTQPIVQIRDQFHNPTTDTNTIVLAAFTDASCSSPAGGTLNGGSGTVAISGTATFSGVNYTKAETIRLQAASGVLTTACSSGVAVSPAGAAALAVTTQSAGATSGAVFTTQPVVEIRDSFGNLRSSDNSSTITVTVQSGPGNFHGTSTTNVTVVNGVATFTNLRLDTAGAYTLRFSTSAGAFSVDSSSFSVGAGAATQLAMTTQPGNAVAGSAFGQQPVVQLRDAANNVVSGDSSSTVSVVIQSGSGVFHGASTTTVSVVNGVATFTDLRINQVDSYTLRFATSAGAFTVDSSTFPVSAGSATLLAFTTQPGSASAGSTFGTQPVVQTRDSSGNPSTSGLPTSRIVTITLSAGTGPLQGTTTADIGTLAGNGTAIFSGLRIDVAGTDKQLTASASGMTAGVGSVFTVTAAALDHFTIATISSPQTAGTTFSVTLTAQDSFSNTVTSFTSAVSLTTNGGTITPTPSSAFSSGVLTQPVTVTLAGAGRVITATSGAQTGASNSFTVTTGTFTRLQLLLPGETVAPGSTNGKTGTPTAQSNGVPFTVTVRGVDNFYNILTTVTDTISITSTASGATLPADTVLVAGTQDFSVTLPATGTITAVDVTNGAILSDTSSSVSVASGMRALTADAGVRVISEHFVATVGQAVQIVVTATNSGPGILTNGRLRWETPAGLTVSTVPAGQNVCMPVEGGWLCDLDELSAGAEVPFTLALTPTVAGEYKLAAAIEGERLDPNVDNDRVTVVVVVSPTTLFRNLYLPFLQSQVDAERNRAEEHEIHLPSVGNP